MTQIISLGTPRYVVQVSDRLVSKRKSEKLQPHDPRFNKHVLFGARDAIVTIGFTGLAYLANVPTDQWIAAMLAGEQPTEAQGGPGRGTRIQAASANWPNIGIAIHTLHTNLVDVFRKLSKNEQKAGLALTIIGWQWKSHGDQIRRMRPILANLFYEPKLATFLTQSAPRYWGWEKGGFGIKAVPTLPRTNFDEIMSRLQAPPGNMLTDEVAESIFMTAIRELAVAAPDRGIGQDLLSVSINVYRNPVVKIRYHPVSASGQYYTGWIVTPSIIQPPQIATMSAGMSHQMRTGLFGISFEGPSNPLRGGFHASSADQPRERPPR